MDHTPPKIVQVDPTSHHKPSQAITGHVSLSLLVPLDKDSDQGILTSRKKGHTKDRFTHCFLL